MNQEYPTFPEEAFTKAVPDAIFAKWLARARSEGRIMDFELEKNYPVYTFWDIGKADLMALVFIQVVAREIRVYTAYQNHHEDFPHYANYIRDFERTNGVICSDHYLPHDGSVVSLGNNGKTRKQILESLGIGRVHVVKRPSSLWNSIDNLRDRLDGKMYLHATNMGTSPTIDGKDYPSAMDCLEGYHSRPVESGRVITNEPVHDNTSHIVAAFRTFADAWSDGMISDLPNRDGRHAGRGQGKPVEMPTQAVANSRTARRIGQQGLRLARTRY